MIRYDLVCNEGHGFDAWFRDSAAFEEQSASGVLACPVCGGTKVEKALMSPRVAKGREAQPLAPDAREKAFRDFLRNMRRQVVENADYVGRRFPEEARRMHEGEIEQRGIYGEASLEEAKALVEEGVSIVPLPEVPEEAN